MRTETFKDSLLAIEHIDPSEYRKTINETQNF